MNEVENRTENINIGALIKLDKRKHLFTQQQYKTFRGQILAGNAEGALKGINRLIKRKKQK